ncbi:5-azacytidine resistance protein azr1, partial [Delitschia confertaspora ATCC 74209]
PTCPLHSSTCPAISGPRSFHTSSHDRSSSPQYSYHVAASYSSKADHFDAERNLYTSSVFDPIEAEHTSLEKCKAALDRRKRAESGQDSFFYSQVGTTGATAFGVADGVGGWTESGIDPADFAHGLCEYMACAARMWPKGTKTNSLHPKDLLQVGYDQVQKDASIVGGGSTACLAVAEPDGKVEVANLGDSGFMHLGLNAVRHFTQPQTHEFNMPYQMSKIPQRMRVQMAIFGSTSASDMPKDSNVTHHHVQHGDVLVFATDGVWDNLFPQDVLSIVSRAMVRLGAWVEKGNAMAVSERLYELTQADRDGKADIESLQAKIAVAIAKEAKVTGLDPRRNGPFAREVKKYFPHENYWGGKPDDIAAVVAVVVD